MIFLYFLMQFLQRGPLFLTIYGCKKGGEIALPKCVLCHLAKSSGGTLGGARDAPLTPGWSQTRVAERLPPWPDSRCAVWRESQPRVWGHRPQRPGHLCHRDSLAPSGYDHDYLVWGL